jgi:hypothetical protein
MVDSTLSSIDVSFDMNRLAYGLIALVALTLIAPAIAIAESEDEENVGEREGSESGERGEPESLTGSGTSSLILYVTIASIMGIIGYSAVRVYQARKRATKKLV